MPDERIEGPAVLALTALLQLGVERALGEVPLVRTGSPYAVTPGRVTKRDGTPFQVFTPFARAWREHGWRAPAARPRALPWLTGVRSDDAPTATTDAVLPRAGEAGDFQRAVSYQH